MKNYKWSTERFEIVIEYVMKKVDTLETGTLNEQLSIILGTSIGSVSGCRKSISLILQGKEPSKVGGFGHMFTDNMINTVNNWYTNQYGGEKTMMSLSHKF
tara:strand:- start:486 stop:788 length:303 start_codon:yes stop_codon:yes gene_type:complete